MKHTIKILSLAAAMLFALPFAACGARNAAEKDERTASPLPAPDLQEVPTDEPAAPEEPAMPEEPEEPAPRDPLPAEEPAPEPEKRRTAYIRVLASALNVRAGAGVNYACLGQAEKGTLLGYAGKNGNWYETSYRGKKAYVSADQRYADILQLDTGGEQTEKIVEEGLKLLGTPYVYGAVRLHDGKGKELKNFTTAEFDCSSLMQYIFYRGAGILLDTTTRTQVKQGEKVEWNDIARGDLLFFTNASRKEKTGVERVGHVALYLGGNYILHTASDFAKIEQITPLRKSYFIEGRRISS